VGLGVEVNQEGASPGAGECCAETDDSRGLADAALLVHEGDDARHDRRLALRDRVAWILHKRHGTKGRRRVSDRHACLDLVGQGGTGKPEPNCVDSHNWGARFATEGVR
jgi:hypothetical protein